MMGSKFSSPSSRGSYQDCQPKLRNTSYERDPLEIVFKMFFQKFSNCSPPSESVNIPRKEFNYYHDYIQEILTKRPFHEDTVQPAHMEKNRMVQLLNTSNATPATRFVDELDQNLKKTGIKTRKLTSRSDVSNHEEVYIIVCNKTDNETATQAVENSLCDIEDNYYKRIILIVLHVKSVPPSTSTREKLKSEDTLGKYSGVGSIVDMVFQLQDVIIYNDNALTEIQHFCSKCFEKNAGESVATAETSMQSTYASHSDQSLSYYEEVKEEFPTPTAYIIETSNSTAAKKFVSAFQQEMRNHSIEISETSERDVEKLDLDAVLLLVCNNNSRIGTDIDRSLSVINEKRYGKTILIILHVNRNDLNRRNSQRTTFITGSEMSTKIRRMIDMSFTIDKGIYDCKMNTNAFKELKEIYNNYATYGAEKTEQKDIETKLDIPGDISENPSDQKLASKNVVPMKRTKTGDEQEKTENSLEERSLVSLGDNN